MLFTQPLESSRLTPTFNMRTRAVAVAALAFFSSAAVFFLGKLHKESNNLGQSGGRKLPRSIIDTFPCVISDDLTARIHASPISVGNTDTSLISVQFIL